MDKIKLIQDDGKYCIIERVPHGKVICHLFTEDGQDMGYITYKEQDIIDFLFTTKTTFLKR